MNDKYWQKLRLDVLGVMQLDDEMLLIFYDQLVLLIIEATIDTFVDIKIILERLYV